MAYGDAGERRWRSHYGLSCLRFLVGLPTAMLIEFTALLLGVSARGRIQTDVNSTATAEFALVVNIQRAGCVLRAELRAVDAMGVLGIFEVVAIIHHLRGWVRCRMPSDGGSMMGVGVA